MDVLLVKIQPNDVKKNRRPDDFGCFNSERPQEFKVCVSNADLLQFRVSKVYYLANKIFNKKDEEIGNSLGIAYGKHVVTIDKYPASQFQSAAQVDEKRSSEFYRYEVECRSSLLDHVIVLLVPGLDPIVLADLNFACDSDESGYCSSNMIFVNKDVLSFKLLFGEVKGITLQNCNEHALEPNNSSLFYTMSFEKISMPAVVLQSLLR